MGKSFEYFRREAEIYRKKHDKPPVIIYDNISRLLEFSPRVIDILQGDARVNADFGRYIALFISSEGGSVPKRKCKINEVAKNFYELVGGHILDLKFAVTMFSDKNLLKKLYHEVGKKVIKVLLDSKKLKYSVYGIFQ
ncbi:7340_t:CDS:2 [Diversispora eburnea]|uniref:7340_t:CDS:1 n=1 Tax=Diversispora eburnea TaxID=1213867 RepID=A0A9N8UZI5_9GLOM|nr:7340_t:CDS:2 [Diversispora eburnea]